MNKLLIISPALLIMIGCTSSPENQEKASSQSKEAMVTNIKRDSALYSFDTTINVGNGFEISYRQHEFSGKGNNITLLTVKHNNKAVYVDKSDPYVLDDSLNPTLIILGNDLFELFLEVGDHPNKNYLKMLKIQSDKVIDSQRTPAFSGKPCHLFDDVTLVYAGTWGYPEQWADSNKNDWVTCDPIMYYKLTKAGLILDSLYTIKKNKEIFGVADVFKQTELKSLPINKMSLRDKEMKRIKNCK